MGQTYTKEEKFAEWDEWGEDLVRTKFNLGHFGTAGDKHALAKMWLEQKDQERRESKDAASIRVARSAKNAAWAAAIAAIVAAIAAMASAFIAFSAKGHP